MKRTLPFDFVQNYREYMKEIGFQLKSAQDWDLRAHSMNKKVTIDSQYVTAFLQQIDFKNTDTVLDIGCGPGTLALKIAPYVKQVFCLDHSRSMLQYLESNMQKLDIKNITLIHLAKEESWDAIVPICDIVVCSRSGVDADLEALLLKLNRYARQAVYFSYLVGGRFDHIEISQLINQDKTAFPDYIYVLNILYQLGIDPNLSFVLTNGRLHDCASEIDFLERMRNQYGQLSSIDQKKLALFYQENHHLFNSQKFAMKWALINWKLCDSLRILEPNCLL